MLTRNLKVDLASSVAVCAFTALALAFTPSVATAQDGDGASQDAVVEAESDTGSDRACVEPSAGASQAVIDAFLADPASLLTNNPLGGLALSNEVRSLAVSNVDTVSVILALEATATDSQARAIGAGLARAAAICVATNAELAAEIQLAVAGSDNEALITAFLSGAGNQDTAGIGGIGADAPGGAGPGVAGITASPGADATALTEAAVGNGGGGASAFGGGNAGDQDDGSVSPL